MAETQTAPRGDDSTISAEHIGFLDVDGIRTRYYDDQGDGTPIVFIHGGHFGFFVPIGIEQWDRNLGVLAGLGRIVAFDKLGQGHTASPASDDDWTFEAVAAHAIGVLDALELSDAILVGHSRGALLALHIAIARPDLVSRLAVLASASTAPGDGILLFDDDAEDAARAGGAPALLPFLRGAQATDREIPASFVRLVEELAVDPEFARQGQTLRRLGLSQWEPSIAAAKSAVLERLSTTGLPIPIHLIWGMNDRSAPIAMGHALFEIVASTTPESSMLILNEAGHNLFLDQPEAFNAAIAAIATPRSTP